MQMTHQTPRVRLDRRAAGELDADLVIVPAFAGDTFADVPGLAQASGGEVLAARDRGTLSGKPFETLAVGSQGPAGARRARCSLASGPRLLARRTSSAGRPLRAGWRHGSSG
jgi:hypothetical protein